MLRIAVLIAIALLPSIATAQAISREEMIKLQKKFGEAQTKIAAKEYPAARKLLVEILEAFPAGDTNRQFMLERINATYGEEELYKDANAFLAKQLAGAPAVEKGSSSSTHAQLHWLTAINQAKLGDKAKALSSFEKAVSYGFADGDAIKGEKALDEIRSDKRFKKAEKKVTRLLFPVAFGLEDLDGKKLKQKDFEGKVLIVDIWGTWCPPCRKEIPHFIELQKKYGPKGFSVIGLTWERREADANVKEQVRRFAKDNEVNYPLVFATQERLSMVPNLRGFPTTLFFGRDGTLRKRIVGAHDLAALEAEVKKIIDEKAPAAKAKKKSAK